MQALEGDCVELAMAYTAEQIGLPSLNEKQKEASCACLLGWKGYLCQLTYKIWEVSLYPEYTIRVRLSQKQPVKLQLYSAPSRTIG